MPRILANKKTYGRRLTVAWLWLLGVAAVGQLGKGTNQVGVRD